MNFAFTDEQIELRDGVRAYLEGTHGAEVLRRLDKPVDVVKIDCEGAEYELIGASSPASWSTVSRVVLEHHPHSELGWPDLQARPCFGGRPNPGRSASPRPPSLPGSLSLRRRDG